MTKAHKIEKPLGEVVSSIGARMSYRGVTVADLARKTGLSRQSIRKLRNGEFDSIHLETLALLCRELDCAIASLIHYEKPKA